MLDVNAIYVVQRVRVCHKFRRIPKQFANVTRSIRQSIRYSLMHGRGADRKFTIDRREQSNRSTGTQWIVVYRCV